MVKSEGSPANLMLWNVLLCRTRSKVAAAGLWIFCCLALAGFASAQTDFTLSATQPSPDALPPGGTSSSSVTISGTGGASVSLSCQVTSSQAVITSPPVCTVSPASVTPPATATATITTQRTTTAVAYQMTVTGTDASGVATTPAQAVTVLAVTPAFTITIQSAISPSSVPAGSGAEAVISVNPINGYTSTTSSDGVTLYCSSITPLVTIAPVCSFSYPTGRSNLPITGTSVTSTLTISTFGPILTGAAAKSSKFYALWVTFPLLGVLGVGAAFGGKRSQKAMGLLGIFVLSGALLLMPACTGANSVSNNTPNGVTPANTYTFTIIGVDSQGVVSSNTGTGNAATTVSLTVTAPPK